MLDDQQPLPTSTQEARDIAFKMVGMVKPRTFGVMISRWWDRLAASDSPEEKAGCQMMIDALGFAFGMHEHERGKALAESNRAAWKAENAERDQESHLARWARG